MKKTILVLTILLTACGTTTNVETPTELYGDFTLGNIDTADFKVPNGTWVTNDLFLYDANEELALFGSM